ncbi:MAG: LWR-salt protein [Haloferacaceae archaeon]
MQAEYVFRVRFRLDAQRVRTEPEQFEAVVRLTAATPGDDGWLFFRNALWRGEVNDRSYARELAGGWLGVPIESIDFLEFECDEEYRRALSEEIERNLGTFNATSVSEAITKYFGSSIRVR